MNNPLNDSYDLRARALGTSERPSTFQQDFDYLARTDMQPIYFGWAPRGVADGDNQWIIYKFTYNADGSVSKREIAVDTNWTNRTSAAYG